MSTTKITLSASVFAIALLSWQCQKSDTVTIINPKDNIPAAYVDADGSHESQTRDTLHNSFPHLRMEGGAISLNDRCPVRKVPLNRRLPALFVNGRPIGFC